MKWGMFLVLACLACYAATQEGDYVNELKGQQLEETTEASVNQNENLNISCSSTENRIKQTGSNGSETGGGMDSCKCVPYHFCDIKNDTIDKIVSSDNCEYLSICCDPSDILGNPETPSPYVYKHKECGVRNSDGIGQQIKGDKENEAQFAEFPWMVAVLREEVIDGNSQKVLVYQCGASLIHPQVVLTSAHCVSEDKHYKIRAGEWDTQTNSELFAHQDKDVKTIIPHSEYYAGALFNDVALLILTSPLEIIDNVDTVCLPKPDEIVENTRCFASGWGKDVFGKEGKYQGVLKKIELPIIQRKACQESLRTTRLGNHFKLHESFICARGEEGQDTCKGDGGSPLVCPIPGHPGRYFQAGIVSWGIGCGEKQIPGVYANVQKFSKWITEQLAVHNFENSYYTY